MPRHSPGSRDCLRHVLFGWLLVGGVRRGIRRVLAVIGTDPRTRAWVLQPADGESPSVVHLLGGRHLLVAGDEVPARGEIAAPARNWHRVTPALFAVTGPFGTLWAQHRNR